MLSEKGKVLPTFPIEYVRKGLPQKTMKVGMARSDIFDSFDSFESFFIMLPGPGPPSWLTPNWLTPNWLTPNWLTPNWLTQTG